MTREEQIRQASIEYTYKNRPMCIGGGAFSKAVDEMNRNFAFEAGAEWADENHKKGLVSIDNVCELLKKHIIMRGYEDVKIEWIEQFRKIMEG